jgi:Cytochrome P460
MKTGLLLLISCAAFAQEPKYTKDDRLIKPENYREWIFLSSGLGMTYGGEANQASPRFDNVFVTPAAYKAFLATGAWPEKTMFALEVRDSASRGSINKAGHYQGGIAHVSIEVKDSSKFPDKWAFFGFGEGNEPAKALPKSAGCQACHSQHGAVDNTFVQFYPTLLPIAKAKGTLKKPAE